MSVGVHGLKGATAEVETRVDTYVVSHLAHQLACDLVEDGLQVRLTAVITRGLEEVDALGQVLRQSDVRENLEVLCVQEAEAGLALDPPQLAV